MKIAIASKASPATTGGGVVPYCREINRALIELGHEIYWIAPGPKCDAEDVNHILIDAYDDPFTNAKTLYQIVDEYQFDGLINNDNPVVQMCAPALKIPVIAVCHFGSNVIAALAAFQHEWVDHLVAISNDMQQTLVTRYGIPAFKCPLVYNGVKDPGERKNDDGCLSNPLKVVFAGGDKRVKGADFVLSMVKQNAFKNLKLSWYGNVSDRIKNAVKQHPEVDLCGLVPREQYQLAVAEADIILVPSREEGCPMVILEAMSHGTLPVTSNGIGAMSSLVITSDSGFVCPLSNWAEEANSCLKFLDGNRVVLKDMKLRSRQRFLSTFQSSGVARRLIELLERPTVDRSPPQSEIEVIRWHRWPDNSRSTIPDRIRYRAGRLKKLGKLQLNNGDTKS